MVTILLSAQMFLIVLLILPLLFTGNDTKHTILDSVNGTKCIQFTHPGSGERYVLKVEYRTGVGRVVFEVSWHYNHMQGIHVQLNLN